MFSGIARPEELKRNMSPLKKAGKVVIYEGPAASRSKASKLSSKGGKCKVKDKAPRANTPKNNSVSEVIYKTHLTPLENEGELQDL